MFKDIFAYALIWFSGVTVLLGGFWFLYRAFLHSNLFHGIIGGIAILIGLRLITIGRSIRSSKSKHPPAK